jgi:WD40 repeat protein
MSLRASGVVLIALMAAAVSAGVTSGCGSGKNGFGSPFDAGSGGDDAGALADSPTLGGDASVSPPSTGPFSDFPSTPILDGAAPSNSGALFGPPSQGASSGGPCLVEPEVGSLYPNNWLRPRFRWLPAGGENLFELRVHAANQVNDLVVYSNQTSWTMPAAMWSLLRSHSADVNMTVSVRAAAYSAGAISAEALGSSGPLGIAPVDAPGTIVYWTTTGGSALKGFSVGDENVGLVLVPSQVQEYQTTCIGCHASTPDGQYAAFATSSNNWSDALASVVTGSVGQVPPFLGGGGKAAIEQNQLGIETFSPAHWATGDRIEVVGYDPNNDGTGGLIWIDLEAPAGATASGTLARNNDPNGAGAPTWSHDGNTIAYVSTNRLQDGRLGSGATQDTDPGAIADIYAIPYASRAGGNATPVNGAADPSWLEYYPSFSPDDRWLAFNRAPPDYNMYNQQRAELYVVPSGGGTATRLAANDPPACTGKTSPGTTNSWPKWSPSVGVASNGRSFYWLIFSSTRNETGNPQLYVTPVVVDSSGNVTTYHALYLWNQPPGEANHTPAWGNFQIPPPPPR